MRPAAGSRDNNHRTNLSVKRWSFGHNSVGKVPALSCLLLRILGWVTGLTLQFRWTRKTVKKNPPEHLVLGQQWSPAANPRYNFSHFIKPLARPLGTLGYKWAQGKTGPMRTTFRDERPLPVRLHRFGVSTGWQQRRWWDIFLSFWLRKGKFFGNVVAPLHWTSGSVSTNLACRNFGRTLMVMFRCSLYRCLHCCSNTNLDTRTLFPCFPSF